ncbi:hypothetical protein AMS68_006105 [Peltaster fructicola]|uniref:Uncharacterized protein n=1 Tax=Peltaster fructicola TaxID=286661 RepID=A0A6H0Y166_9PEZI|nr:hypothetical protein AMS68_006105 [Peltaster fructicola]
MGIKGLLPLLEGIQKHTHLRTFAGQTLGVDAYGWLHRGTFACATELAQGRPTRAYVNFAMNRVRMLIHFGVTPYIVFDGDYLPSKAHTEQDRAQRRRESRRHGLSLLQAGKTQQAFQELQKSIDVTPLMARELIEELKAAGISYVVAPYEADSQLAYLEKQGLISGIISEDSDLLVFGAARLITKLDQYGGCVMIRRQDFTLCREISLINWSDKEFRMMAMLSGCDYLAGIDGLGLKTAYRLVRKYKTIEQIVRNLQFDGKKKVPQGFLEAFHQADRTFLHQWVYCPNARCLINLTAVPQGLSLDEMPYIGKCVEPELAQGVATGDLDPNSKKPIVLPPSNLLPRRRSAPVPATPDLKSKKPITDWFKRTPLAELDPNSFTPSPSQQRLLGSQQNRSWSTSQIRNGSRPADNVRRASLQVQTPVSISTSRLTHKKAHLSPRRKRLCADVLADLQGENAADATVSHYFAKSAATKKSKEEFELFSDDSIAEALQSSATALEASIALSQEAAVTTSPKKRKRLEVFQDGSVGALEVGSENAVRTRNANESHESASQPTQTTSYVDSQTNNSVCAFEQLATPWTYQKSTAGLAESCIPGSPILSSRLPGGAVLQEEDDSHETEFSQPEQEDLPFEMGKGSEDILIPQSPSSNEDDGRLRPKLDLGRFVFAAP